MDQGSYRIYHIYATNGKPEDQLVGRFLIQGKQFFILEDHDRILEDSLADGPMTPSHEKFLWRLAHSGVFRIVHEGEVNEGHHPHLVDDLDIGPTEPEQEYILTGRQYEPERVEMFRPNCYYRRPKVR